MVHKAATSRIRYTISNFNCIVAHHHHSLIETGQEDVNFKLFVVGRSQQQTQVGEVTMELSDLHDQEIHEIKLQLRDGRGPLGTTLIIDAQWMYNKV